MMSFMYRCGRDFRSYMDGIYVNCDNMQICHYAEKFMRIGFMRQNSMQVGILYELGVCTLDECGLGRM